MRLLIIYSDQKRVIKEIAEGIAQEARKNNHTVELYGSQVNKEFINVRSYDKVLFGSHSLGFWNKKIPADFQNMLKKCRGLLGKKTIVFLKPGLIRKNYELRTLMNFIETQGAFIENFALLKDRKTAEKFGQKL